MQTVDCFTTLPRRVCWTGASLWSPLWINWQCAGVRGVCALCGAGCVCWLGGSAQESVPLTQAHCNDKREISVLISLKLLIVQLRASSVDVLGKINPYFKVTVWSSDLKIQMNTNKGSFSTPFSSRSYRHQQKLHCCSLHNRRSEGCTSVGSPSWTLLRVWH